MCQPDLRNQSFGVHLFFSDKVPLAYCLHLLRCCAALLEQTPSFPSPPPLLTFFHSWFLCKLCVFQLFLLISLIFTTLVVSLLIFSYQATTAPGPDDDVVIRVKSYIGESFLSPRITIVQQINDILQTLAPAKEFHPLSIMFSFTIVQHFNDILQTLAPAIEFHRAPNVATPQGNTTRSSPTMAGGSLSPTR